MTKEELKKTVLGVFNPQDYRCPKLQESFNEFFSQNVVIPKGENRHPYADVYHLGVEGIPWEWSEDGINWYDVKILHYQYRIKPSEPVYEWQWVENRNNKAVFVDYGAFFTEDEAENLKVANEHFYKIEWTKRERKQ